MILDSMVTVATSELTPKRWQRLLESLIFTVEDQEVHVYNYLASKRAYRFPRGVIDMLPDLEAKDLRSCPKMPELTFTRVLDTHGQEGQSEALTAMFQHEQGQIIRMPGSGKTQVALAFIAKCKTRTLVLTHTIDIMDQWRKYAEESIPGIHVGTIQGQTCEIGHLTLATPQTLKRFVRDGRKFWGQFGAIIVDESHHSAAQTFEWVLNVCPAKYRFGFTATEKRADEMHPLIRFLIGPVIHQQDFKAKIPMSVVPVRTGFKFQYRGAYDWSRLLKAISQDEKRNRLIARIADEQVKKGHSVLVLSRRVDQLVRIQEFMETNHNRVLIGSRPEDDYSKGKVKMPNRKEREKIVNDFREGEIRCLLATQLADEALDIPRLNRIILTYPGKHDGRIIQQVGRGAREHESKQSTKIYDMVDVGISVLERQYLQRKQAYKKMGLQVEQGIVWKIKKTVRKILKRR